MLATLQQGNKINNTAMHKWYDIVMNNIAYWCNNSNGDVDGTTCWYIKWCRQFNNASIVLKNYRKGSNECNVTG